MGSNVANVNTCVQFLSKSDMGHELLHSRIASLEDELAEWKRRAHAAEEEVASLQRRQWRERWQNARQAYVTSVSTQQNRILAGDDASLPNITWLRHVLVDVCQDQDMFDMVQALVQVEAGEDANGSTSHRQESVAEAKERRVMAGFLHLLESGSQRCSPFAHAIATKLITAGSIAIAAAGRTGFSVPKSSMDVLKSRALVDLPKHKQQWFERQLLRCGGLSNVAVVAWGDDFTVSIAIIFMHIYMFCMMLYAVVGMLYCDILLR